MITISQCASSRADIRGIKSQEKSEDCVSNCVMTSTRETHFNQKEGPLILSHTPHSNTCRRCYEKLLLYVVSKNLSIGLEHLNNCYYYSTRRTTG